LKTLQLFHKIDGNVFARPGCKSLAKQQSDIKSYITESETFHSNQWQEGFLRNLLQSTIPWKLLSPGLKDRHTLAYNPADMTLCICSLRQP